MSLPVRTPEERAADLEKAAWVRFQRSEVKKLLKQGDMTMAAVLEDAVEDDVLGKMKVASLLQAMPGVGKVGAMRIMGRLGIAENRRVAGLGSNQRQALADEFAPAAA